MKKILKKKTLSFWGMDPYGRQFVSIGHSEKQYVFKGIAGTVDVEISKEGKETRERLKIVGFNKRSK